MGPDANGTVWACADIGHETSEHDIVTKKHDQSDAPGRLSRIMDETGANLAATAGCGQGLLWTRTNGRQDGGARAPGELIAKPVNSDVLSRGCEVLATSEGHSLADPEEEPKNRRGQQSVRTQRASRTIRSNAHTEQSRRHGTAERGTGWSRRVRSYVKHGFVVKGRELLRQWRDLCGPARAPDAEPGLCCMRGNRLK